MNDKEDDIIDNMFEKVDQLNEYLNTEMKNIMKRIIITTFDIYGYSDDLFRVLHMTNTVVNNFVSNFLTYHQDVIIKTLKEHNIIIDFSDIAKERESMK